MVGFGTAVMVIVRVEEHPELFIPVTVYIVVTVGDTETTVVVRLPGNHVYETAPKAVIVALCPMQIDADDAVREIEGTGFTMRATVAGFDIHPCALVPVIV
jgi:hypothetical protein